jgi:hypothetical protein
LQRYVQATPAKVHQVAKQFIDLEHIVRLDIIPGKREAEPDANPVAGSPAVPAPTGASTPASVPQSSSTRGGAK